MSPGLAIEVFRVKLADVPTGVVPTNHAYETVGVSPSASSAVAVQVSVDVVTIPVVGRMAAETVGFRLSTTTFALSVATPPELSVTEALQVITSLGDAIDDVSVSVSPQARVVPAALVQRKVTEGVPPSGSDAVASHFSVESLVTPLEGVMVIESTTGSEFSISALALAVSVPVYPSVAVAVHTSSSPGETMDGVSVRLVPVPKELLDPLTRQS